MRGGTCEQALVGRYCQKWMLFARSKKEADGEGGFANEEFPSFGIAGV